jgi:hypothetical protein
MSKKVSKEQLKTLTLNDYIAKAKQKEKSLKEFKNVPLGDSNIVVNKLSDSKILDLMDEMDEDSTMKENILVFNQLIL